ncbi:hypothetical protein EK904_004197, partial [Melospiza melodia maxima]
MKVKLKLRRQNRKTRRYGVLDMNIENMELTPLEQDDDDDDDDTTLFDASHPRSILVDVKQTQVQFWVAYVPFSSEQKQGKANSLDFSSAGVPKLNCNQPGFLFLIKPSTQETLGIKHIDVCLYSLTFLGVSDGDPDILLILLGNGSCTVAFTLALLGDCKMQGGSPEQSSEGTRQEEVQDK